MEPPENELQKVMGSSGALPGPAAAAAAPASHANSSNEDYPYKPYAPAFLMPGILLLSLPYHISFLPFHLSVNLT